MWYECCLSVLKTLSITTASSRNLVELSGSFVKTLFFFTGYLRILHRKIALLFSNRNGTTDHFPSFFFHCLLHLQIHALGLPDEIFLSHSSLFQLPETTDLLKYPYLLYTFIKFKFYPFHLLFKVFNDIFQERASLIQSRNNIFKKLPLYRQVHRQHSESSQEKGDCCHRIYPVIFLELL